MEMTKCDVCGHIIDGPCCSIGIDVFDERGDTPNDTDDSHAPIIDVCIKCIQRCNLSVGKKRAINFNKVRLLVVEALQRALGS